MVRRAGAVCAAAVLVAAGCARAGEPLPPAATTDVEIAPSGEMAHLTAVRLTAHDRLDRLELEFADRLPGSTIGYRPLPAHEDASGFEIPLPGATAVVTISMSPATAAGWGGGATTYGGPSRLREQTAAVTEVRSAGDFEAVLTWVVGLRTVVPFSVRTLADPPRVVVDFRH